MGTFMLLTGWFAWAVNLDINHGCEQYEGGRWDASAFLKKREVDKTQCVKAVTNRLYSDVP
jgi:hypothetical protein